MLFFSGHYEFPPYNPETLRSVYHIRNIDVFKLKQVTTTYKVNISNYVPPILSYLSSCLPYFATRSRWLWMSS